MPTLKYFGTGVRFPAPPLKTPLAIAASGVFSWTCSKSRGRSAVLKAPSCSDLVLKTCSSLGNGLLPASVRERRSEQASTAMHPTGQAQTTFRFGHEYTKTGEGRSLLHQHWIHDRRLAESTEVHAGAQRSRRD